MYSLIYYPHKTLLSCAQPVTEFGTTLEKLLKGMKKIMNEKKGVGIAAPQINISSRCFFVRLDKEYYIFINPIITSQSPETNIMEEGCLSLPGVYADVKRASAISVTAYNQKGKIFSLEADGYFARIIQHEMDHLDGILFIDRISVFVKKRILKVYEKMLEKNAKNA